MSPTTTTTFKRPSVLGGAMIIAGTAVGAGMFTIPIVTSGVWFSGSVLLLAYTWLCMYFSGLMILEANLNFPIGSGFHTMVKGLLGNGWNLINSLSIAFVLYILTYAYISEGGSMIRNSLAAYFEVSHTVTGLIFVILVAFIVWLSTRAVDRINTILIGGMVITFVLSMGDMFLQAKPALLLDSGNKNASYLPYALAALPYLLASFGYHGNVPGLVKYYRKDSKAIANSLLIGTLTALTIYLLWQYVFQGNISREEFKQVIANGANIDSLLSQLDKSLIPSAMNQLITIFAYMAVTSSFLGVSLGLLDYIADLFSFGDDINGRTKSALITFVPPTIGALCFPNGFLYAIGFAGLAATVWAVIVPAMLARASRRCFPDAIYRAPGGKTMIAFVVLFGVINAIVYILANMNLLPIYQ